MSGGYDIAAAVEAHADKVLRAAGSGLRHYTMPATRRAILSAMIDAIEEAAESERAAIVAWLRREFQPDDNGGGDLAHWIADAIERGEHQPLSPEAE